MKDLNLIRNENDLDHLNDDYCETLVDVPQLVDSDFGQFEITQGSIVYEVDGNICGWIFKHVLTGRSWYYCTQDHIDNSGLAECINFYECS